MNVVFALAVAVLSVLIVQAQITVTGISPRTEYTDRATFTIASAPGYSYSANLNGVPVPISESVSVTNANYYELLVQRTTEGSSSSETLVIPFIVVSSARGSSEVGLPPWTPLSSISSAAAEFAGARAEILAPQSYPAGMPLPLVIWIRDENGRRGVNAIVRNEDQPNFIIRRGVGSLLLPELPDAGLNYELSLPGLATNVAVALETNVTWLTHSGEISSDTTWPAHSRVLVQNLTVPAGVTLTIEEGSVLQVATHAEILVSGTLRTRGQMRHPVVFAPISTTQPWGGIELRDANARLELIGAILTGGGADPDWFDTAGNGSSHRDEQPILFASNGARIALTDSALIYGAGQAGHGENGYFDFTRTLIQGFVSAGQYNRGSVTFVESAAIEFPVDDHRFADEDNDGFYLTGGAHYLTNSLIGWAKDDGIDAGSGAAGSVTIVDCWIESCYHEGLAWSEDRTVTVRGTVVMNCGQGIEAGFGSPNVTVSDSFSTANVIGARFGDNYDWDYNGFLRVTNSVLLHNFRDVWGFTWNDWTYRSNQMDIAGNFLTAGNSNHPSNEVWNPDIQHTELLRFLSVPAGPVGVALALRDIQIKPDATNIPVRLSTFTTNQVKVDYLVQSRRGTIIESNYSGTLLFAPGQTVQEVPIATERLNASAPELVQIELLDSSNAEISGLSRCYLLRDDPASFRAIVPQGSIWKYPDPSTDLGSSWKEPDFDDSGWASGTAELGNGDGDESTPINIGQPARFPTIYFRHQFAAQPSTSSMPLVARLKVDDGGVVYLNGQELFRVNMPAGAISYSTLAASTLENRWFTNIIPASVLSAETNLLAVEVHQRTLNSSDLSFDFELRQDLPLELRTFQVGSHLLLSWPRTDAVLEESPTLAGPWREISSGVQAAEVSPTADKRFYRLKNP